MQTRIILLSMLVCSAVVVSRAQQASPPCQQPAPYIEKGDVTAPFPYQPVSVSAVAGQVSGAIVGLPQGMAHVCLSLFTERKHKLVGSSVTDESGNFQYGDVPAGEYRMVVRAPGFFVAEIPVHVSDKAKAKAKISKPLKVLLQSPALHN